MIKRRVICYHKVEDYITDKKKELEGDSSPEGQAKIQALDELWNTLKGELEELEVPNEK